MVMKRKVPGSNLARKNISFLIQWVLIQWKHLTQLGQGKTIGFNTVGTGKPDPKTIYGIQHSGTGKPEGKPDPETIYGQRPYMGFNTVGQENQTQKTIGFNTVGRKTQGKTRPRDHIWAKTIYGIQHSGTGESDPKDDRIQHMQLAGKPDPETIYGQRPYMGFNTVGQENQTQKTIGFNTVGRKTRPRDHIWAKTIYGIQHSGTGKSDPKDDRIEHSWQENQTQRPYMGFNTVGQENQTQKTIGLPRDHIWAKTIYGIQHSGTGKPDPKTIGPNTVGTGKPDQKAIYGQRPYMGFSTVGQGNRTQRP